MYMDDNLEIKPKYTNEYLLISDNYAYDIMWTGCRNNCVAFIKKMFNNKVFTRCTSSETYETFN